MNITLYNIYARNNDNFRQTFINQIDNNAILRKTISYQVQSVKRVYNLCTFKIFMFASVSNNQQQYNGANKLF